MKREWQFLKVENDYCEWITERGDFVAGTPMSEDEWEAMAQDPTDGYFAARQSQAGGIDRQPLTEADGLNSDYDFGGPFDTLKEAIEYTKM